MKAFHQNLSFVFLLFHAEDGFLGQDKLHFPQTSAFLKNEQDGMRYR